MANMHRKVREKFILCDIDRYKILNDKRQFYPSLINRFIIINFTDRDLNKNLVGEVEYLLEEYLLEKYFLKIVEQEISLYISPCRTSNTFFCSIFHVSRRWVRAIIFVKACLFTLRVYECGSAFSRVFMPRYARYSTNADTG